MLVAELLHLFTFPDVLGAELGAGVREMNSSEFLHLRISILEGKGVGDSQVENHWGVGRHPKLLWGSGQPLTFSGPLSSRTVL